MGRRRDESEFMNRELTKSFPQNNDSKIARRSLLGMAVGLAGSLVATEGRPPMAAKASSSKSRKQKGKDQ
jgi:hypothetical protein